MTTNHANQRISERYLANNRTTILSDLRIAKKKGMFFVRPDLSSTNRVQVFFSSNGSFLWKVVVSKIDGTIITVLPVGGHDLRLAREKGVIYDSKRRNKVYWDD